MGKRSSFARIERDFYPTPPEAVAPLLPHLESNTQFIEPCVGDGALAFELERHGHDCILAYDIAPRMDGVMPRDALTFKPYTEGRIFITNPPWSRDILHPLILHLSNMAPTWLLADADWMHTRQSAPYMKRCHMIVSVGRVKWIKDSPYTGKDNCCWFLFGQETDSAVFIGRT
jgi:hypothetical protein